ncbi:isoaspartyl peptidase/L-asparaginase-like isoform X2 [Xenia sp. Carnegie-2017]|uniref:isoaspartyl peptidase/L-asparaginase-like isoform X2 n=1 Tax=Xenia sp. Carnegie-2017 TaxID=2897299 RepID=UPI001F040EDA|nr:isoaspartyl peptidase/L-asparaginase-like isoform X2 [Xenia sp. Carnegie-2017]
MAEFSGRIAVQISPSYYVVVGNKSLEMLTDALTEACRSGFHVLSKGGTAVDAVEKTISYLEDLNYFNCGFGSLLNNDEEIECDAMIMDGTTLNTGAVMAADCLKNPVQLARKIMEKTIHTAIAGAGVEKVAKTLDHPTFTNDELKHPETAAFKLKYEELPDFLKKHLGVWDSVSAVAMDKHGHFACASSTGGLPGRLKGRLSEACTVGCGGYANEYGAATAGGYGEAVRKMTLARQVVFNMESGQDAQNSVKNAVEKMKERLPKSGFGSAIAIDRYGNISIHSTTSIIWSTIAGEEELCGARIKPKRNQQHA